MVSTVFIIAKWRGKRNDKRNSMNVGFKTDTGKIRTLNEDALLVLPGNGLFAVADGVGGSNSGEIASRRTVNGIKDFFEENPVAQAAELDGESRDDWFRDYFLRCFRKVNCDIRDVAQAQPENKGMATTAVAAYFYDGVLYITNIGDSRAYMIRAGEICQLTEDHSYVADLVNAGTLTKSEARDHPRKNMITRAIGAVAEADPDFFSFDTEKGDRLLLCSDGLHGEVTDDDIRDIIVSESDMNSICGKLVQRANDNGGKDNITVVCLEV
jgi:protein phosphatase